MKSNWPIKSSLLLNYIVFAMLLNSVGIVILQVKNQYGIPNDEAKFLEGYKDITIMISSFFVGLLMLRIGYKRSMQIGLLLVTAISLSMPFVPTFWMCKLLFAVVGFSFALVKIAAMSTVGLVTEGRKGHLSFMSYLEATFMVGLFAGYLIFSEFISDNDPDNNWLNFYYVAAAISFAAFLLLSFSPLDESQIDQDEKDIKKDFYDMIRLVIKPLVLVFVASIFLYVLIEQGVQSWLPTFNNEILNIPSNVSVKLASIMPISIALGRYLGGFFLKRYDWLWILLTCLVGAAVLLILSLPLAQNVSSTADYHWYNAPLAAYIFPLIGLWLAPIYPALNSLVLSALPLKSHAPMTGLIVLFSALGGTVGSIITGSLFDAIGGAKAFYFILAPVVFLVLTLFLFKRLNPHADNKEN